MGQRLARGVLPIACMIGLPMGCASDPRQPAPPAERRAPTPPVGTVPSAPIEGRDGHVKMVIASEPAQLNPDLDPDEWSYRLSADAIYEPLWRARAVPLAAASQSASAIAESQYEPALAERFTVEDEGRRLTFHLRRGALFHDGAPVHSTDVTFTIDKLRARTTRAPRLQAAMADLDRVELAGPDAVRFWLVRPSAWVEQAIAEIGILPEHVFGRGDINYHAANRRPIGTGPFKLRSWERGHRIVLERFAAYNGPPVGAEEIDVSIEADAVRGLGEARRGEIDLLGQVPPAWVPEQLDSPSLRAAFETVRTRPARFVFVLWNLAHPPLDDPAVRRAIGIAIDRDRLLADARHGLGRPIAAPALGGATGPAPRYDLLRAGASLDGVGLTRSGEGPRGRAGRPLKWTLLVPSGAREAAEAGKRVTEALGKLGIGVDVASGDLATIMLRMRAGKFDAALLEWSGRDDDDLSALFRGTGSQNFGHYEVREVDLLLDALRRPAPVDERRALFGRLASALDADPPALFLYAPDEVFLVGKRLGPPSLQGSFVSLRALGAGH